MSGLNFCRHVLAEAQRNPQRLALDIPLMQGRRCLGAEQCTYGELMQRVSALQLLWQQQGLQPGERVVVIARPSVDLYAVVLSLLASGLVAVFIDTGMGRKKIRMALADARPVAIVSMQALLRWFWLIPELWSLKRFSIDRTTLGSRSLSKALAAFKGSQWPQLASVDSGTWPQLAAPPTGDHGLISFTSGSTGRPKGADRTHASLDAQHAAIRHHWPDADGERDSPCFPVMVLHNLSCGMSSCLPEVDLAAPAQVDAAAVLTRWQQQGVTRISGAPAYFRALCDELLLRKTTLPQITSLVIGGAPVSQLLARDLLQVFPNAYARIAYGSTEAEPIASLLLQDYLYSGEQPGVAGLLVGDIAEDTDVLICNLPANSDALLNESLVNESPVNEHHVRDGRCDVGEEGEILVAGRHVLRGYYHNPQADAENKIPRADGLVWHRTGDTGWLDEQGRLWLSGRVKDAVQLGSQRRLQPLWLEQQLDALAGVQRSALIGYEQQSWLFLCCDEPLENLKSALLALLPAGEWQVARLKYMPVDGRHNSKIDRPLLRQMAAAGRTDMVVTWNKTESTSI
jgi:olefin beta-lactone synthetase